MVSSGKVSCCYACRVAVGACNVCVGACTCTCECKCNSHVYTHGYMYMSVAGAWPMVGTQWRLFEYYCYSSIIVFYHPTAWTRYQPIQDVGHGTDMPNARKGVCKGPPP